VLTSRRLIAVAVSAALVSFIPGGLPTASADPPGDQPGCMFIVCPTDPPGQLPPEIDEPPIIGDVHGCEPSNLPVDPRDTQGQSPPDKIAGAWAYQLCGDDAVLQDLHRRGLTSRNEIVAYCADKACSLLAYWKPKDKDPRTAIPIEPGPDGIEAFFTLRPVAASSPPDGRVFTNFPTWFYDANHLRFTAIPPVGFNGFGGAATAIHLRSWWNVDGERICDHAGHPVGGDGGVITRDQAVQESDCNKTFPVSGQHAATAHNQWLIIVVLTFPPYLIVFPIEFSDTMNVTSREVQADTGRQGATGTQATTGG
jgi:hypothetical protein